MVEGLTRATWDQMRDAAHGRLRGESLRFAVKEDLKESRPARDRWSLSTTAKREDLGRGHRRDLGYRVPVPDRNGVPAEDARGLLPMNV
jgi:hypothetical protein